MKRWPLRILICLILLTGGAITTVAVALGCARLSLQLGDSVDLAIEPLLSAKVAQWKAVAIPDTDSSLLVPWVWKSPGYVEFGTMSGSLDAIMDNEVPEAIWARSGIPAKALQGTISGDGHRMAAVALVVGDGFGWRRVIIPLDPLWPGFAIDTLFYAAIWFGVFFGFASAKRAIRRRRGRCPMCGYDLRGALENGCSECGWGRSNLYAAPRTWRPRKEEVGARSDSNDDQHDKEHDN